MDDLPFRAAPRFFVSLPLSPGAEVELPPNVVRHVAARRLRAGDAVTLFNGEGGEFAAQISLAGREQLHARISAWRDIERESPLRIDLALGISGGERMDYALQKAAELGAWAIRPVATERSVVKLDSERADRRLAHWRGVVAAACEQCGRNRLPKVGPISSLDELLQEKNERSARIFLSPDASGGLRQLERAGSVLVLVGPEGGLSAEERRFAQRCGFIPVRFGPRILRTETAPLAAIAVLQAMWGDC